MNSLRRKSSALARLAALSALLSCATTEPLPPATLTPLAPDVWLHASYRDVLGYGRVFSHGLAIRSGHGVLLVDTAWTDPDTERVLELVRGEVGADVREVVVTHAHADKMGGMRAIRAAGVRSWAHPLTNEHAPARGLLPASDALFADGANAQQVGGVEVFFPGAGHARDNLVVYFAPARVLFGGCLVRPGDATDLGNTADGDVANWAAAVRAVRARFPEARVVVPSHGPPGGPELLDHTIALAERASLR